MREAVVGPADPIGCGGFAGHFVPLFAAHPTVEWVKVCDLVAERAASYAKRFGVDSDRMTDVILVTVVLAVLCKAFTREDCELLPKGEKIAKLLRL